MEFRLKWSEQHVKRINSQWRQVIPIATDPARSQLERVGALVIADRAFEYLLEAINWSGDSVGRRLSALKEIVPDFKEFARARAIRNKAVHRVSKVRHKELLLALLEYQRVLETLGVALEERIELEAIRQNGAPILRKYLN
jgi:hypothetical protein